MADWNQSLISTSKRISSRCDIFENDKTSSLSPSLSLLLLLKALRADNFGSSIRRNEAKKSKNNVVHNFDDFGSTILNLSEHAIQRIIFAEPFTTTPGVQWCKPLFAAYIFHIYLLIENLTNFDSRLNAV